MRKTRLTADQHRERPTRATEIAEPHPEAIKRILNLIEPMMSELGYKPDD